MRLQFVEDRFAGTDRQSVDATFDDAADGIAFALIRCYRFGEFRGISLCTYLHERSVDRDSLCRQFLFGDTTRHDACSSLTGTRPTTASPVANTIFLLIDFVGVPDTISMFEPLIVFGAGIFVTDEKGDRSAKGK